MERAECVPPGQAGCDIRCVRPREVDSEENLAQENLAQSEETLRKRNAPRPVRPKLCSPMEILSGDEMKEYLKRCDSLEEGGAGGITSGMYSTR